LTNSAIAPLATADLVIAVGSVDGVCTAAAVLRLAAEGAEVYFTQAFTVDKLPVGEWHDRKIVFVDLPVNNSAPQMTSDFVAALRADGNIVLAVIDEHSREDWIGVLGTFDGLMIEPQSQNAGDDAPKSSGDVLRRALVAAGVEVDSHTAELMEAADQADRNGNFTTRLGGMVNEAIKSAIWDDSRRVHLARHLAAGATEPDERIAGWITEYEEILSNHDIIVNEKVDLGDGIHRVNAVDMKVDMTTLMFRLYGEGARVVALYGEAYVPAEKRKRTVLSLGTNDKSLDLLSIVKESGVHLLGGFAQKVNVEMGDERKAIEAVRAALRG